MSLKELLDLPMEDKASRYEEMVLASFDGLIYGKLARTHSDQLIFTRYE